MRRCWRHLVLASVPAALLFFLLWQTLIPSGTFSVSSKIGTLSPFIDRLLPDQRVAMMEEDGDTFARVTGDPAFFFVHPPRRFDSVDVTVTYKNKDAPVLELGGLATAAPEVYDLNPLQQNLLNGLDWPRVGEGQTLYQRDPRYGSIDEFQRKPPMRDRMAVYHTGISSPLILDGDQETIVPVVSRDYSVRGGHQIKTFFRGRELQFDFAYVDENKRQGSDPVVLRLFDRLNQPVAEGRGEDDGEVGETGKAAKKRFVSLRVPSLGEGVYTIDVEASEDIVFQTVETPQRFWVFTSPILLSYAYEGYPIQLVTFGPHLAFEAPTAQGVQRMVVDDALVSVSTPFTRVKTTAVGLSNRHTITSYAGDIRVISDGPIAFDDSSLFMPDAWRLLPETDLDAQEIDFILTDYTPPTVTPDGWSTATATFDASTLLLKDGAWKFALSLPSLPGGAFVDVKQIDVTFHRPPFSFSDLKRFLPWNL
ncbi:hypothetical protein HYV73_04700 [Candidatus Uhrbacteria bacterium]|nr:hypothetical protein [Candidatus Uhrbacteria bacterium]